MTAAPADTTAPAAPTGLTATPGDRMVALSWTATGEPDLAGYRVLRGGLEVTTVTGTTCWTDSGLTNGTTYTYAIVAVDTADNRSAASTPVDATPADPDPPAAPTGLTATPGDRQVALSWAPNGEPDLASVPGAARRCRGGRRARRHHHLDRRHRDQRDGVHLRAGRGRRLAQPVGRLRAGDGHPGRRRGAWARRPR